MVELVFLLMGVVWQKYNADTQGIVERRKPKGREKNLMLIFCLAMKYKLYFAVEKRTVRTVAFFVLTFEALSSIFSRLIFTTILGEGNNR